MSKILKICLILLIVSAFIFSLNTVFATSDEDLQSSIEDLADTLNEETIDPLADNLVGENEDGSEDLSDETSESYEEEPIPESDEVIESMPAPDSTNPLSASSVTKVSTINSYEQANLQLNNILSIILIAIGILLILFAIAILIRLSK